MYEMKPLFEERIKTLLPDKEDFKKFSEIIHTDPKNFIRCNTLKMQPEALLKRLKERWNVKQPFPKHQEIMLIDQELGPGELGNALEHLLGYYYIQEVSSMLSVIALNPQPGDFILDVAASPGSKTTQMAAKMENKGTLIANDVKLDRIMILATNLEKNGVTNCIITKNDGVSLCQRLAKSQFKFDKILLDAPCSGEGTLRSSPKTFLMWNPKMIKNFAGLQKKLFANAVKCLKVGGSIVYSTCTHAPEEDEGVVQFALSHFPLKIESIQLPLKCRPGISSWEGESFSQDVQKACRIYPQDNDSEGFFVAKFTLLKEIEE